VKPAFADADALAAGSVQSIWAGRQVRERLMGLGCHIGGALFTAGGGIAAAAQFRPTHTPRHTQADPQGDPKSEIADKKCR
jgi:hypothetical protein